MNTINVANIPHALRILPQWVLWRTAKRSESDKPTKLPFQLGGQMAASDNPDTWSNFSAIEARHHRGGYDGIGFMFAATDEFCGVDLDGCRDPQTGKVAEWAREIILSLDSYGEVSPSETGVKLFMVGKNPFGNGKKKTLDVPKVCDKEPAIEIYDRLRYFAVTGLRIRGHHEPQSRQAQLEALAEKYWDEKPAPAIGAVDFRSDAAVIERARKYMRKMPPAVSGQGGHNATFHAACVLICGFDLNEGDAMALLREYNQTCNPQWSERELQHKVSQALKQGGQRGYLRYASPQKWESIRVPHYEPQAAKPEPRITTVGDAAAAYLESIKGGETQLIEFGIPEVDYAIGGGIERGELVVLAARPSHGKSMVSMQCVHGWTGRNMPCVVISEEMGALAVGKRTVQFVSDVPQEHWQNRMGEVTDDVTFYREKHAKAVLVESCGTTEAAIEQIDRAVADHGAQVAVVDYAQLLRSPGKSRYEQVTNTSIALKTAASRHKIIVLMLCQLSREIEKRTKFMPMMSDLKESGQIEQDADLIMFLVWPWQIDNKQPSNEYMIYIAKNRNRPVNQHSVKCRIQPSRQRVTETPPAPITEHRNYEPAFDRKDIFPE